LLGSDPGECKGAPRPLALTLQHHSPSNLFDLDRVTHGNLVDPGFCEYLAANIGVRGHFQRYRHGTVGKLLEIDFPVGEHIGGGLAFGLDGYLYLSIGDGGGGGYGDKEGNAQNLNSLLGKLLRLDVDSGNPYAIPVDNPFADGSGKGEVWVYGLRNPWRFSFDSSTGDLFIADVGENQSEELDFIPAGSNGGVNFGWNYQEGTRRFQGSHPPDLELIPPIWEYDHSLGCAITGGVVYRGKALPEFNGVYLAADYCSGRIWGLLRNPDGSWKSQELFKIDAFITSFSQDDDGEVYAVDFTGEVLKLVRR